MKNFNLENEIEFENILADMDYVTKGSDERDSYISEVLMKDYVAPKWSVAGWISKTKVNFEAKAILANTVPSAICFVFGVAATVVVGNIVIDFVNAFMA